MARDAQLVLSGAPQTSGGQPATASASSMEAESGLQAARIGALRVPYKEDSNLECKVQMCHIPIQNPLSTCKKLLELPPAENATCGGLRLVQAVPDPLLRQEQADAQEVPL
jgi:hypothetical protein